MTLMVTQSLHNHILAGVVEMRLAPSSVSASSVSASSSASSSVSASSSSSSSSSGNLQLSSSGIIWAQVRAQCFLTLFLWQARFALPLNLSESHQLFTFLQAGSSEGGEGGKASLPLSFFPFFPSYFFMYSLYS